MDDSAPNPPLAPSSPAPPTPSSPAPPTSAPLSWGYGWVLLPLVLGVGTTLLCRQFLYPGTERPTIELHRLVTEVEPPPETKHLRLVHARLEERQARTSRSLFLSLLYLASGVVLIVGGFLLVRITRRSGTKRMRGWLIFAGVGFLLVLLLWIVPDSPFDPLVGSERQMVDVAKLTATYGIHDASPGSTLRNYERLHRFHQGVPIAAAFFAVIAMGVILGQKGKADPDLITAQLDSVRKLFYALAALLVVGVIAHDVGRAWLLSGLTGLAAQVSPAQPDLLSGLDGLSWSLTLARGAMYTVMLLFVYVPCVWVLKARAEAAGAGRATIAGLDSTWKTWIVRALTILAPLMSASLAALLQSVFA